VIHFLHVHAILLTTILCVYATLYISKGLDILPIVLLPKWLWVSAVTVGPFILIRSDHYNKRLLNHEMYHLQQQFEMLILGAYLWYAIEYLCKLVYYRDRTIAYYSVSFEREAYLSESVIGSVYNRKPYAWLKYVYWTKPLKVTVSKK